MELLLRETRIGSANAVPQESDCGISRSVELFVVCERWKATKYLCSFQVVLRTVRGGYGTHDDALFVVLYNGLD